MNKISLEEVNKVVPILLTNKVNQTEVFDYFRIVALNNKQYEKKASNPLYFLTYNTQEEVDNGWFESLFDLRNTVNERMESNPNATFVIEPSMIDGLKNLNAKFIVVENIRDAIDKLFEYVKSKSNARVISVTGSVGKTTTVGLIESVLKEKYTVLRIYSKRITPIILKANIINFLNEGIDCVVLENSIYYHDHIKVLCDLLSPDIACMLNIESSHLGVDKLDSLDAICVYKSEILRRAKIGIINSEDEHLKNIDLQNNGVEYKGAPLFKTELVYLDRLKPSYVETDGNDIIIDRAIKVTPFIQSKLAKIQYQMACEVGKMMGLTKEEIEHGMKSYEPVENRLNKKQAFNKEIIFDGDVTTYERMKELSDLNYDEVYLVIRKAGSSENTSRISSITDHFNKFKKVYVFDDIEYLEELKDHENVEVVHNHDFMANLEGKIIYHYSGYYRTWNTFDENNLNIYDKTVYPIKKDKKSPKEPKIRKL